MTNILEHEILQLLYTKPTLTVTAHGSEHHGYTPIYKRMYGTSHLEFGLLVDMLNNPEKYSSDRLDGKISWNSVSLKREDVVTRKYGWFEVSEAIDVLEYNQHIKDSIPDNIYVDSGTRIITLTAKGVIAYRNKQYLKEYESEELRTLSHKISKIEYRQKRYGFWYDILKFIIGGIIGALITLLSAALTTRQYNHPESPQLTKPTTSEKTDSIP